MAKIGRHFYQAVWAGLGIWGAIAACSPADPGSTLAQSPQSPTEFSTSAPASIAMDTLRLPPPHQTLSTTRYIFTVAAEQNWSSPYPTGRLQRRSDTGLEPLWEQTLPQEYGPRFMAVGQQGHVLLLDEYVNVASPYAVLLLDEQGEAIAQYSFDDIQAALGVTRADLVAQAEYGWWISAAPAVDETQNAVTVAAGGKTLTIDLTSGQIGL